MKPRTVALVLRVAVALGLTTACTRQPNASAGGTRTTLRAALPHPFEGADGKFGYRGPDEREVLPARYHVATVFGSNRVAFVVDDQGWACIDERGSVRLRPFVFDNGPDYEAEGRFRYVEGGQVGFSDGACRVIIPARWDFAGPFAEGRAPVCTGCVPGEGEHAMPRGGKWGFIDRAGREVIPLAWDFVYPFEGGKARVERTGLPRRVTPDGALVPVVTPVRFVAFTGPVRSMPYFGELGPRRAVISGCADEDARFGCGSIAVALVSFETPDRRPHVSIERSGADPDEFARCVERALDGVSVGVKTLVIRIGTVPDEATFPPTLALGPSIGLDGRCEYSEHVTPCPKNRRCRPPKQETVACPDLVPASAEGALPRDAATGMPFPAAALQVPADCEPKQKNGF